MIPIAKTEVVRVRAAGYSPVRNILLGKVVGSFQKQQMMTMK